MHYFCTRNAQMAELVDALVSNTSGFTSMPVRSRLWVQKKRRKQKSFLRFVYTYTRQQHLAFNKTFTTFVKNIP